MFYYFELMREALANTLYVSQCTHYGDGPNTVSESTVSNTRLSEFLCPHQVPARELSELLSVYYLCDKANSTEFLQSELTEFTPKLSEAQWVLFSETVLSKQYSARFLSKNLSAPPLSRVK